MYVQQYTLVSTLRFAEILKATRVSSLVQSHVKLNNRHTHTSHMSTRARLLKYDSNKTRTEHTVASKMYVHATRSTATYCPCVYKHCRDTCKTAIEYTSRRQKVKCTYACLLTRCAHQVAAAVRKQSLLQQSQMPRPPLQEQRGAAEPPAGLILYHKASSRTKSRGASFASCCASWRLELGWLGVHKRNPRGGDWGWIQMIQMRGGRARAWQRRVGVERGAGPACSHMDTKAPLESNIVEVLPKNGLVYSEKVNLSEVRPEKHTTATPGASR